MSHLCGYANINHYYHYHYYYRHHHQYQYHYPALFLLFENIGNNNDTTLLGTNTLQEAILLFN